MRTSFRGVFAFLLIGMTLAAAAVAPAHSTGEGQNDFVGSWITWEGAAEGETPVCRRLLVTGTGTTVRDGAWDAPGWTGVVNGTVRTADDGRPLWRGEWRDGQIAGTFALTLRGDGAFEGTFAGAGLPAPRPWRGRRHAGDDVPDVPCRLNR